MKEMIPLSLRQRKAFVWWARREYEDYAAIICDGAIRSGKTLAMGMGFFFWAMACFSDRQFALCGRSVGALRRNLLETVLPQLRRLGFACEEKRSEKLLIVRRRGRENRFYLFGGANEASAALIQGMTLAGVLFDEAAGRLRELPRQELVLFTPLLPESENPYGVSLLRSMPFMAELLSRIYYAVGQNWERCGNVRFAVVYKPQGEEPDGALARERAELLAQEWSGAMQETRGGSVRDFVSVGDVSIRAIGADNVMPDCEVPVRQILEQLVAKTGLPPFLLGLSWSSTERMSSQQADMLTSEITALRRTLTPMVERVCRLWLRLHGYGCRFAVEWDDINLQDLVEEAKAELYREQARRLRLENDEREEQT